MPTMTADHLANMADDGNGVLDSVNFYSKDGVGEHNVHNGRTVVIALHGVNSGDGAIDFATESLPNLTNPGVVILEPISGLGSNSWWQPAKSFTGNMSATDTEVANSVAAIARIVGILETDFNMTKEQIVLLGHSQGGSLAAEVMFNMLEPFHPTSPGNTPPARFKNVALMNSGIVGMFMDDQAEAQAFPWWNKKVYGQKVFMGSHAQDPTVPELISRRTADLLFSQCGAVVDYDVSTGSAENYHKPHPDHFAAFNAAVMG